MRWGFIVFIANWEQMVTWLVLFVVLFSIVSGKLRYDLTAFGGLLLLGMLTIRRPSDLFSGFSSPALFTIAAVLVMSAGIVESGILAGLGKRIAGRIYEPKNQILAVFLSTGFVSALMNNVGAVGIMLPTAQRMARRAKVSQSAFGIPIAYASILGGSLTLIGTASNLIVSTYRLNAFGEPFRMFDFIFHGLIMFFSGITVVFLCRLCGLGPIGQKASDKSSLKMEIQDEPVEIAVKCSRQKKTIVIFTLIPIVILTAIGILHPAVGFGMIVLVWLAAGVFSYKTALANINVPIIIFLGSMFGISAVLEETGALNAAVSFIRPVFVSLPPLLLIFVFLFITGLFANVIDNSVAAVLMAPVAIELTRAGAVAVNPDALLMAVAAGAGLGIVIPTHQATLVVMDSMEFPRTSFIKTGAAIALMAGIFATLVIYAVWC